MENLGQFLESTSKWAEQYFIVNGYVEPIWIAEKADGERFVIKFPDGSDKDAMARSLRFILQNEGATRYCSVMESWAVFANATTTSAELDDITDKKVSLATHPKRIELLYFSAEDKAEGMLEGHRPIIRTVVSKAPALGPLEVSRPQGISGRFVGLLPRDGTSM